MTGHKNFQAILESVCADTISADAISDEKAAQGFRLLLNLAEELVAKNRTLRDQVQRPRDEINRLKKGARKTRL